jgi:hypothetical protein
MEVFGLLHSRYKNTLEEVGFQINRIVSSSNDTDSVTKLNEALESYVFTLNKIQALENIYKQYTSSKTEVENTEVSPEVTADSDEN